MSTHQEIINKITHLLDDNKAEDIVHLPVEKLSTEFDSMIICTATSQRHVNSLADYVAEGLKETNVDVYTPKRTQDEWIIVDADNIIIHIMTARAREFYRLEELWQYYPPMDQAKA